MTPVLALAAVDARTALDVALAATTYRVPCRAGDGDRWFAPDAASRAQAATACQGCPVLDLCHAYAVAARERHGTWGGRDRETRTTSTTTGQSALDLQEIA